MSELIMVGLIIFSPFVGFNVETVSYKNVNLTAWDVGGRDKIVRLIITQAS